MALDADTLVDRRRLKRRVSLWRFAAVVAVGLALFAILNKGIYHTGAHVARIDISGIITDDQVQQELIAQIAENDNAKALILRIDSPGGTTTGAEALYEAVRKAAEKKPVVAVLGTIAASGGYIAALSADHVVARGNTLTGSIGVLFQWAQFNELLDKIGIEMRDVKSAPLKAEPNPFNKPSPQALRAVKDLVDSSFDWFVGLVAERRGLSLEEARKLGDGRVYTGWQAVGNGLVDEIGGEDAARAWLAAEHDIDVDLPTEDWQPDNGGLAIGGFGTRAAQALGAGIATGLAEKTLGAKRLTLDGLVSLWHPEPLQN